ALAVARWRPSGAQAKPWTDPGSWTLHCFSPHDHTATCPWPAAVASSLPSGENAAATRGKVASATCNTARLPRVANSHSTTWPLSQPIARLRPSGEKLSDVVLRLNWLSRNAASGTSVPSSPQRSWAGAACHKYTVSENPPVATVLPSDDRATASIASGRLSVVRSVLDGSTLRSRTRAPRSKVLIARVLPSGPKARHGHQMISGAGGSFVTSVRTFFGGRTDKSHKSTVRKLLVASVRPSGASAIPRNCLVTGQPRPDSKRSPSQSQSQAECS